jgi:hypothetical protein
MKMCAPPGRRQISSPIFVRVGAAPCVFQGTGFLLGYKQDGGAQWLRSLPLPQPHLICPLKSQTLVQRLALLARVQHHCPHIILLAPIHHRLHQLPRQSSSPKPLLRINIHNISSPSPVSDHVRRPIHQPQSRPGRDHFVITNREPRQIFTRLHLPPQPHPKFLAHPFQLPLIPVPHIEKHFAPVPHNNLQIPFVQTRRSYFHFPASLR